MVLEKSDRIAVRDLYQQLMEAWNRGDSMAFAAPFTEDGDLIGFDGMHLKGRGDIARFHDPLFRKSLQGTRLVGEVKALRFLAPDVALLHAVGQTIMPGHLHPSPERDSIQTLVALKRSGEWRLAAFHNTRQRPMGRGFGGTLLWLFSDRLWRVFNPKR